MIRTVIGNKGSGKTKRLIDLANESLKTETGNIVFIDDNTRYIYDLRHEIRFINISEYDIDNADKLYGMVCGMLAVNYDISLIFIDPLMHIMEGDVAQLEKIIAKFEEISNLGKASFVLAVSGSAADMPECITRHAV